MEGNAVMKKRKVIKKTPKVVVKKRRTVKKKTKPPKEELISRARLSREMRAIRSILNCIRTDLSAIRHDQETITRSVDAVMKDYIRHPLKIDGMNQQAFRALVDAAARNNPASFKDDFNGKLDKVEMFDENWPLGAPK
jgi:hypothetical protein